MSSQEEKEAMAFTSTNMAIIRDFLALAHKNQEIAEKIAENRTVRHPEYQYYDLVSYDGVEAPRFDVEERFVETPADVILSRWNLPEFNIIPSLPKDTKITFVHITTNYVVTKYSDLPRLNKEMQIEVDLWKHFRASDAATDPLKIILSDCGQLNMLFEKAWEKIQDTPSRLAECKKHCDAMNAATLALKELYTGFGRNPMAIMGVNDLGYQAIKSWVNETTGEPFAGPTLVYRATVDGFAASQFHAKCDNKERILVVARSASGFIFGGFSSKAFTGASGSFQADPSAFLFTLSNPANTAPTMYRSNGNSNAVYQNNGFGATYGSAHDFHIINNSNTNPGSYCQLGGSYKDHTGRGSATFTGSQQIGLLTEVMAFKI